MGHFAKIDVYTNEVVSEECAEVPHAELMLVLLTPACSAVPP